MIEVANPFILIEKEMILPKKSPQFALVQTTFS